MCSGNAAVLIRKAVGNAYRHSQATKVRIDIGVTNNGLEITVTNAGLPLSGDSKGLGTQLLNAGTIAWSRTHSQGTTRLHAVLAQATHR